MNVINSLLSNTIYLDMHIQLLVTNKELLLPHAHMHKGVKKLVLSICLSVCQCVSAVKNFEI